MERYYRAHKVYKMRLECIHFNKYHKYIHQLLGDILCRIFGIDDSGHIDVFIFLM